MLGLDVGGTKIELAFFDDQLDLIDSWRIPTPKDDYKEFLQAIASMVATADQKLERQSTVGIGIPGFVGGDGSLVSANVPCLNGQYLGIDLPDKINRPVAIDNDTKNFVYSEANGGAGANLRYVVGIILGTGTSGNFCVDGDVWHGANGLAGEFGHVSLPAILQQRYDLPLRQCGCGKTGCLEPYLSGPGLLWFSQHFGNSYTSTVELMQGYRNGEQGAENAFAAYIDCLGMFFAHVSMEFDPSIIVLGGGLSKVPEIFDLVPPKIYDHLIKGFTAPKIVRPKFGDSSGVRGAAMLGRMAAVERSA